MYRSQAPSYPSYRTNYQGGYFPRFSRQQERDELERQRRLIEAEKEAERRRQQQSGRDPFNDYGTFGSRSGFFGPQRRNNFWDGGFW
jgi:hypothetical protein